MGIGIPEEGVQFLLRPASRDTAAMNCNDIIRKFIRQEDADIYLRYGWRVDIRLYIHEASRLRARI